PLEDLLDVVEILERAIRLDGVELEGPLAFRRLLRGAFGDLSGIRPGQGQIGVRPELAVDHAAEEVVDRLVAGLADDIPARHLHGAQGGRGNRARMPHPVDVQIQLRPEPLDDKWCFSDQMFINKLLQTDDMGLALGTVPGEFTEPDDPLVRDKLEEDPSWS